MKVKVVQPILGGNDRIARELKKKFDDKNLFVFNVISSPGAGKTTFLENLIGIMGKFFRIGVIVGDIEDTVDAQRLSKPNVTAVQINTRGACHLDANMVREGAGEIALNDIDLLIIENVGNLVCPAGFFLGEDIKIVILSVTEGDDKPKKYPGTFFKADAVLINKLDLLPHTNFSIEKAKNDIRRINPLCRIFEITATRSETLFEFVRYLEDKIKWKKGRQPKG